MQGFTAANNWTLDTNTVTLDNNATFDITAYNLSLNPGGNGQPGLPDGTAAGSAFGETLAMTLSANPAVPGGLPMGAITSVHWLQFVNTDSQVNSYGFDIAGEPGKWQLDNGQVNGGAAAGAGTGPYYDSNPPPALSVPPTFFDFPRYYAGGGAYFHFTLVPVWDVFVPAAGMNPATETIYTADYGVGWGFYIVPEPSTVVLFFVAIVSVVVYARRQRT